MANIELPKDAEGREIPLDTAELHTIWGIVFCIEKVEYARGMGWCFYGHLECRTSHFAAIPSSLYLTPCDSWEKLEDDLGRCIKEDSLCPYNPSEECSTCVLARDSQCHCDSFALKDILDRIRKLRGES